MRSVGTHTGVNNNCKYINKIDIETHGRSYAVSNNWNQKYNNY